jgi:hypothetical protein
MPEKHDVLAECRKLLTPERVWSRAEVLSTASPVPKSAGVYAWYFRNFPAEIPSGGCLQFKDLTLLYVGIAPSEPKNGKAPSEKTLFDRVRFHYGGNAEGSTLRLSLGCLLSTRLSIELRRVGDGKRFTFAEGEQRLSEWMAENAFVVWMECAEPWNVETRLISAICVPLNLSQNTTHPFHRVLSLRRKAAKSRARELPVWTSAEVVDPETAERR